MKGTIKIMPPEGDGPMAGLGTKVVIADTGVELPMVRSIRINIPIDDVISAELDICATVEDISAELDREHFVSELESALSIYADAMDITFAELQVAIAERHTGDRGE